MPADCWPGCVGEGSMRLRIMAIVVGLGVLGKEGSGRLRMVANQSKLKISAKNAKKARQAGYGGATSGLQSSGMQTSLAFTPVQIVSAYARFSTPSTLHSSKTVPDLEGYNLPEFLTLASSIV
eukprot:1136170-Pelagomonas_calceolata.AAC.10